MFDEKFQTIESPLFCKHVKIIGENSEEKNIQFLQYVNKVISGKSDKYEGDFAN